MGWGCYAVLKRNEIFNKDSIESKIAIFISKKNILEAQELLDKSIAVFDKLFFNDNYSEYNPVFKSLSDLNLLDINILTEKVKLVDHIENNDMYIYFKIYAIFTDTISNVEFIDEDNINLNDYNVI